MPAGVLLLFGLLAVGMAAPLPQLAIPPQRSVKIVAYECPGYSSPRHGGYSMEVWRLLQGRLLRGEEWVVEDIVWMSESEAVNATRHLLFDILLGCTAITKDNRDGLELSTPIFETALGFMVQQPPSTTSELTVLLKVFLKYLSLISVIVLSFGYICHFIFKVTDSLSSSMWFAARSVLLMTTDEIQHSPIATKSIIGNAAFYFTSYIACLSGILVMCMCTASMVSEINNSMTIIKQPSDLSGKSVGCIGKRSIQYGEDIGARVATSGVWEMLKSGTIKAIISDIPTLILQDNKEIDNSNFYIHPIRVRPYGVGFAYQKNSPLRDLFNPAIIEWRDEGNTVGFEGGVDTLVQRFFGDLTSTYSPVKYNDNDVVFVVCGILASVQLCLCLVIFLYRRKSTQSSPATVCSSYKTDALHSVALLTTLLHKGIHADDDLYSAVISSLDKLRSELKTIVHSDRVREKNRVFPDHEVMRHSLESHKGQSYKAHSDFNEF